MYQGGLEKFIKKIVTCLSFDPQIFSQNTVDVISSPKFLNAEPKTLETIFKLDALNIDSEMQLIVALERCIKHNEKGASDIEEKVRPALNCIRFLTLSPTLLSKTSLLDPENVLTVIGCLPPDGDASKMPTTLSISTKQRGKVGLDADKIRALSDLYSAKLCHKCYTVGNSSFHAIWNCSSVDATLRTTLKNIYEKYKSTFLMNYDPDDLISVYDFYKTLKYVN